MNCCAPARAKARPAPSLALSGIWPSNSWFISAKAVSMESAKEGCESSERWASTRRCSFRKLSLGLVKSMAIGQVVTGIGGPSKTSDTSVMYEDELRLSKEMTILAQV